MPNLTKRFAVLLKLDALLLRAHGEKQSADEGLNSDLRKVWHNFQEPFRKAARVAGYGYGVELKKVRGCVLVIGEV